MTEWNSSGQIVRRYVHGPGVDEPLVWYEGSGTDNRRWLHRDERGSIVAISDGTGQRVAINSYDEFGTPAGTNVGRFQYTGQTWMPELSLYHYKARMYAPALGRFMQTDPIGYEDDFNLYAYVGNDPLNKTDPTGRIAVADDVVILGAIALVGAATVACQPGTACNEGISDALTKTGDAISKAHESLVTKIVDGIFAIKEKTQEPGSRQGKDFTKKGKEQVKQENRDRHAGTQTCENCGRETVPAEQSKKGVSPPDNETHVDHIDPKSTGQRDAGEWSGALQEVQS